MKKTKIGVLMGGSSSEREISLVTGKAVVDNLDRSKYTVTAIEMSREGYFVVKGKNGKRKLDLQNKDRKAFDCIFIALHGKPGEDGTVQGMLDMLGIPYTGSGTLASALAMDKVLAGKMYEMNELPTPPLVSFTKEVWKKSKKDILKKIKDELGASLVVKPADQGSAVGVALVDNQLALEKAVVKLLRDFSYVIVQKCIKGREATCGVIEKNGVPIALPPTHILPQLGAFYDFKSKYKSGGSTHICPADFPEGVNAAIQALAVKAHVALGCRGMSRTDIFYADDGKLWILETNTIPGMTPTSLFPEAAAKAGIHFPQMLDILIRASYGTRKG